MTITAINRTLRSFLICVEGMDLTEISEWLVFEGPKARALGDERIRCVVVALDGVVYCRVKGYWTEKQSRHGIGAILRTYFSMAESQVESGAG
jgi:hypothetical protein